MRLTQARIQELFEYDKSQGVLIRKTSVGSKLPGSIAGTIHATGHGQIAIDGKTYRTHRVIFLLVHGWLPKFIDHIDRNPANNRIDNLRPATPQQNNQNKGKAGGKSSIYKGVSWSKRRNNWRAVIVLANGKAKELGSFISDEEAAFRYNEVAIKEFGPFASLNRIRSVIE